MIVDVAQRHGPICSPQNTLRLSVGKGQVDVIGRTCNKRTVCALTKPATSSRTVAAPARIIVNMASSSLRRHKVRSKVEKCKDASKRVCERTKRRRRARESPTTGREGDRENSVQKRRCKCGARRTEEGVREALEEKRNESGTKEAAREENEEETSQREEEESGRALTVKRVCEKASGECTAMTRSSAKSGHACRSSVR